MLLHLGDSYIYRRCEIIQHVILKGNLLIGFEPMAFLPMAFLLSSLTFNVMLKTCISNHHMYNYSTP